jgi:glycerol uptake facilitator-like aquaporin
VKTEASLTRRALTELVGTAYLLAAVVGSGIMAERLAGGNQAIALLANAIATGAALATLILACAPLSGAHFNPAVTLTAACWGEIRWKDVSAYAASQLAGAWIGVLVAHAMFGEALLQISTHERTGAGQFLSEVVATFGLLAVIARTARGRPDATAVAVGLYITAAYWFTSSTSFANPAVTIARAWTNTFAGIRPHDVLPFLAAQGGGAFAAVIAMRERRPYSPTAAEFNLTSLIQPDRTQVARVGHLATAADAKRFTAATKPTLE